MSSPVDKASLQSALTGESGGGASSWRYSHIPFAKNSAQPLENCDTPTVRNGTAFAGALTQAQWDQGTWEEKDGQKSRWVPTMSQAQADQATEKNKKQWGANPPSTVSPDYVEHASGWQLADEPTEQDWKDAVDEKKCKPRNPNVACPPGFTPVWKTLYEWDRQAQEEAGTKPRPRDFTEYLENRKYAPVKIACPGTNFRFHDKDGVGIPESERSNDCSCGSTWEDLGIIWGFLLILWTLTFGIFYGLIMASNNTVESSTALWMYFYFFLFGVIGVNISIKAQKFYVDEKTAYEEGVAQKKREAAAAQDASA